MKQNQLSEPSQALIDELGALEGFLQPILAPLAPKIKRAEDLRKAVRALVPAETSPDVGTTLTGRTYIAVFGKCRNETTFTNIAGMFRTITSRFTKAAFFKLCEPSVTKAKALLGEEELKRFATTARTGYRELQTSPIATAAATGIK